MSATSVNSLLKYEIKQSSFGALRTQVFFLPSLTFDPLGIKQTCLRL